MVDNDGDILPLGYRFYPTEEELISFYLQQKLQGRRREDFNRVIPVLNIYEYNPWDLPQLAGDRCRSDPQLEEWFFFIPRQEREARGGRPNRLTTSGYWKATGSPGWIYSSSDNRTIGVKRTMVFYQGRARTRTGTRTRTRSKTEWKMNEYMAVDTADHHPSLSITPSQKGEYTVCRVYKKSKCLRAFDRRPAAAPIPRPSSSQLVDHQPSSSLSQPINDYHNQPPLSMVERVCSTDGLSSSGDHPNNNVNPSQATNNQEDYTSMEIDEALLWDWDSLNWSF